jgi:hypothetical protein
MTESKSTGIQLKSYALTAFELRWAQVIICIYVDVLQQNVVYELVAGDQSGEEEDTHKLDQVASNSEPGVTDSYR